jgi:exosortase/archaeosortase family protein
MLTRLLPPRKTPIPRTLLLTGLWLVGLHLLLVIKVTGHLDQWVLSALFWGVIIAQINQHLPRQLPRSRSATGLGTLIICLLMLKTWHLYDTETAVVRLFPLVAFVGWSLMVRGWRLVPWWQVWALVITLSIPPRTLPLVLESTMGEASQVTTAAMAAFGLHYLGFEVVQQGSLIQLAGGTVDVEFACTGVALLALLLQVSVLIAAITHWRRFGKLAGWSLLIATLLSVIRVAIMAAVVSHDAMFQFWHGPNGGHSLPCWLWLSSAMGARRKTENR